MLAYVDSLAGQIQPETDAEYRNDAATLATALGNPPLGKFDRTKLRQWISKQTLSKSRIDSLLRPLRGMFAQLVDDGALAKNPLQGFIVKRLPGADEEDEIDPFTPDEIAALSRQKCGDLWVTWAWMGPRSGEVIGLKVRDVDLENGVAHVRRAVRRGREKAPKTRSGVRDVELLAPAKSRLAVLIAGRDPDEYVFINPNTGRYWYEAKALNRAFARDCKAANVRRRYVYQLRHTFATWALTSGENPAWIAKQLGHASVEELYDTYGRWMPELAPNAGSRMLGATELAKSISSKARRGQNAA